MGRQQNCEKKNGLEKQHHSISKKRDIIPQKWAVSKIVRREEKKRREEEKNGFEKQSKTLGFLDIIK